MTRKNRSPEENARREKIRELLQMANIGSCLLYTSKTGCAAAGMSENGVLAKRILWRYYMILGALSSDSSLSASHFFSHRKMCYILGHILNSIPK